jgi:hypothetical protein
MKRLWRHRRLGWLAPALALTLGCAVGDRSAVGTQAAAAAHTKAQQNWRIQLDWTDGPTNGSVERMDIHLVEDESQNPEGFEILGEDAVLVGDLPMDIHVGVDAEYKKLVGKTIGIKRQGGNPAEPKYSWVMLGGEKLPVEEGTFQIEKLTGKWEGSDGDKTYWGTLELKVGTPDGYKMVHGRIAVHCVTWG